MKIYDLNPGEKALIEKVLGDEKLAKRLSALGLVEGTEIPISQAFTLERVIPSFFAISDCVNFCFVRNSFIFSAIITKMPPLL